METTSITKHNYQTKLEFRQQIKKKGGGGGNQPTNQKTKTQNKQAPPKSWASDRTGLTMDLGDMSLSLLDVWLHLIVIVLMVKF